MKRNTLIVTVAVFILFAGCSLFNSNNEEFYPLAKGNYWNLKMSNQTFIGDSTVKDTIIHMRNEVVDKVTLSNGKTAYEMKTGATDSLYNFALMGNRIFYIEEGDTAYFEYDSLSQAEGNYMAPITIDIGSIWDTDTAHIEVTEIDSIEVPAGKFEAYKMASVNNGDTSWQWMAKGVGLVKMLREISVDSITTQRVTMELDSYKIK